MNIIYYLFCVREQGSWYAGYCAWRTGMTVPVLFVVDVLLYLTFKASMQ